MDTDAPKRTELGRNAAKPDDLNGPVSVEETKHSERFRKARRLLQILYPRFESGRRLLG